jgi:hypothetical protein
MYEYFKFKLKFKISQNVDLQNFKINHVLLYTATAPVGSNEERNGQESGYF